ncbi:extensin [Streptomyces cinereoruber]|uniref:extensin n=1 Tax=Streptomyces cinereoruber TaxID=67260 RepID=UPI0036A2FD6A
MQRSTTPPPVTVVVPGLPRATASPAPRPDVLPLATGRALAPNLPGNTHAPASPRTPAVQAAPATSQPVVPLAPPAVARPIARPVAVQRRSAPEAPMTPAPAPTPGPAPVPAPLQRTAVALPQPPTPAPAPPTPRRTTAPVQQAAAMDPAAPSGSESPVQLDELARRLVTPLSRLLRAELRADRERVGRLRDHGR